jgi:long-chain acyl-CoA synthetase
MTGYFANLDETRRVLRTDESGRTWLHTGDVVRVDADGYFHLVDRKKDMIIHSGLKIYPSRVEHVLLKHTQIADVAVIGQADAVHTEKVVAFVVTKDGELDREALRKELRALCREHLAAYEVPAHFEFTDRIPRSALGKVLKKELRQLPPVSITIAPDETENDPDRHTPRDKQVPKEAA